MAFRQYTQCVKPENFVGGTFAGTQGLIVTIIAGVIYLVALALAVFIPAVIVVAIAAIAYLIAFLTWWLYGRLICLREEDVCVIGVATGRAVSKPHKKGGDDDASFNVALAPSRVDLSAERDESSDDRFSTRLPEPKEHYWTGLQGVIVAPNDQVLAVGRGYVSDEGHVSYLKAIHSEFEGSGIRNLLIWANATLAILIAAAALASIPIIGTLLTLLALLLTLIGVITALTDPLNPGDPQDVDPNLGELGAYDVVVMKGNWVYDSLHDGWNEIHAIHACQIIGRMDDGKTWPTEIKDPQDPNAIVDLDLGTPGGAERAISMWCQAIQQAEDAEEGGSRDDPAQNWVLHPRIDGCHRVIVT